MTHNEIEDGMGFGGLVESPEERWASKQRKNLDREIERLRDIIKTKDEALREALKRIVGLTPPQYDRDSEELKSLLKEVAEIADKSREKIREALALE